MKKNLSLKSALSLRALEAMAIKASAMSEVRKHLESAVSSKKKRNISHPAPSRRNIPQIERDVRSIIRSLSSQTGKGMTMAASQLGQGLSARWSASAFRLDDLRRQKEEEAYYREQLRLGSDRRSIKKPFKANPVVMYVFYPDTNHPDRLGSVAVYSDDAPLRKAAIDRKGSLFGLKVVSTSLEKGRRLFVDVKFAVLKTGNEKTL